MIAALLGAAAASLITLDLVLSPSDQPSAARLRVTPAGVAGAF